MNVGDFVVVKNTINPKMTISKIVFSESIYDAIGDNRAMLFECVWFDKLGLLRTHTFDPDSLKVVEECNEHR